jgi:hypothetical protein
MFEFGECWGGLCLGPFQFVNKYATNKIKDHEYGHSIQNILFGPLFLFIVGIPSLVRCYLYNHKQTAKQLEYISFVCLIFLLLTFGLIMLAVALRSVFLTVLSGAVFLYAVAIVTLLLIVFILKYFLVKLKRWMTWQKQQKKRIIRIV